MSPLVRNDSATSIRVASDTTAHRQEIAPGATKYISEEEMSSVPMTRRGAGQLVVVESGSDEAFARIVEELSSGTIYIGEAPIGTATSAASWRISRVIETSTGSDFTYTTTWADGDQNFDNVWSNRASLSYS